MFHVKRSAARGDVSRETMLVLMEQELRRLERVTTWAGATLDDEQIQRLAAYATWLTEEAIPAGGIGPDEGSRIWDRHICDSLAFAAAWRDGRPGTAADLGSGVGLPGIPLAILWPDTRWSLIDRSRRRVELARRAIRILDVDNVRAYAEDFRRHRTGHEAVVARGVLSPQQLLEDIGEVLSPGGRIAVGLTRSGSEEKWTESWGKVIEVPSEVLDGGGKILIIDSRDR